MWIAWNLLKTETNNPRIIIALLLLLQLNFQWEDVARASTLLHYISFEIWVVKYRWSIQIPKGQYRDHLVGQLTRQEPAQNKILFSAILLIKFIGEITAEVYIFLQSNIQTPSELFTIEQEPERIISLEAPEGENANILTNFRWQQLAWTPFFPDLTFQEGHKIYNCWSIKIYLKRASNICNLY